MSVQLHTAVSDIDAAVRRMNAASHEYAICRAALIEVATAEGITTRRVVVIGKVAWYIDPPGAANNTDWMITYGSPPEKIETY